MSEKKWKGYFEPDSYYGSIKIRLPLWVAEGAKPGPSLLLIAGQHGRELHGTAALSRVFEALDTKQLSGRVVMFPIMNPLGMRMRKQDIPDELPRFNSRLADYDFFNMNRMWDMENKFDSIQQMLTEKIYHEYVTQADALLDIHGWQSMPMGWTPVETLAKLLNFGLKVNMSKEHGKEFLTGAATAAGVEVYTIEIQPQNYLNADSVALTCRIISNMLKVYGALPGEPELPEKQYILKDNLFIKAPCSGLAEPCFRDHELIPAGAEYIRILSPDNGEVIWRYHVPEEMLNIFSGRCSIAPGMEATSIIEKGMTIGHLAKYEQYK